MRVGRAPSPHLVRRVGCHLSGAARPPRARAAAGRPPARGADRRRSPCGDGTAGAVAAAAARVHSIDADAAAGAAVGRTRRRPARGLAPTATPPVAAAGHGGSPTAHAAAMEKGARRCRGRFHSGGQPRRRRLHPPASVAGRVHARAAVAPSAAAATEMRSAPGQPHRARDQMHKRLVPAETPNKTRTGQHDE